MGLVLGVIAFIVIGFVLANFDYGGASQQDETQDLVIKANGKYLTGLPDKIGNKDFHITIYNEYIELFFVDGRVTNKIPLKRVYSAKIVSESFIREQISLGKMLAFGVFSLAMKKKQKQEVNNYLQLSFKYENEKVKAIFSIDDDKKLEEIVGYIRNVIRIRKENKLKTNTVIN